MSTTVSKDKVRQIAESMHQLRQLNAERMATQAQLIRWCVTALRIDPEKYRISGFELSSKRKVIIAENRRNQQLAYVYLDLLATQLEDEFLKHQPVTLRNNIDPSKGA